MGVIKCEIKRLEDQAAFMLSENNEEIVVPKHCLSDNTKIGDVIILTLETQTEHDNRLNKKAKSILNEILGHNNPDEQ